MHLAARSRAAHSAWRHTQHETVSEYELIRYSQRRQKVAHFTSIHTMLVACLSLSLIRIVRHLRKKLTLFLIQILKNGILDSPEGTQMQEVRLEMLRVAMQIQGSYLQL
eukprot:1687672-Amphidinium_carterae.1